MTGEAKSESEVISDDESLSRGFWTDPDPLTQLQFAFENGERSESFIWRKYALSMDLVHARGCNREKNKNEALASSSGKTKTYAGAGTVRVSELRPIVSRGYFFRVAHVPEDGDVAHVHVTMINAAGGSTQNMPKNDRLEMKRRLLERLLPIDAHTCPKS